MRNLIITVIIFMLFLLMLNSVTSDKPICLKVVQDTDTIHDTIHDTVRVYKPIIMPAKRKPMLLDQYFNQKKLLNYIPYYAEL